MNTVPFDAIPCLFHAFPCHQQYQHDSYKCSDGSEWVMCNNFNSFICHWDWLNSDTIIPVHLNALYTPHFSVLCAAGNINFSSFYCVRWAKVNVIEAPASGNMCTKVCSLKMDLEEIECEDVDWIHLVQCWVQWWAFINSMEHSPSSQANGHSVKKFLAFYGTKRLITIVTRPCHWTLSWARWIQSTPSHSIFWRFVLIFSHLCPGLLSGLFPLGFPTKIWYAFLISPMHATCPTNHILDMHPKNMLWSV